MDFKDRLLDLINAWAACPEIVYELDNMKQIRLSKNDFGKAFNGKEVEVEKNDSRATSDSYKYIAYTYVYGVKVFCYINEEDIDNGD